VYLVNDMSNTLIYRHTIRRLKPLFTSSMLNFHGFCLTGCGRIFPQYTARFVTGSS